MKQLLGFSLGVLYALSVQAGEVRVAVAANFAVPMQQIVQNFEKQTGHKVKLSIGSSGRFYAQIHNGAPFDVFLSADEKLPELLEKEQLAVSGSRFVYAQGKLVLWSADDKLVDAKGLVLSDGRFRKLAYADPKLAPYGLAAQQVLKSLKLEQQVQNKLVMGESVTQAWQFVATGNAELGFVALSQILQDGKVITGSYWLVPEQLYQVIQQSAVLLQSAQDKLASQALLDYLKSTEARALIQKFGYALP